MKPSEILYRLYGGKRGDEVLSIFNKWVGGMNEFNACGRVSKAKTIEGYNYREKASTTTDAGSGGYLVPVQIRPEVGRVLHDVGQLLARLSQVIVPAGSKIRVNELELDVEAFFRVPECDPITESHFELEAAPEHLKPAFVGCIVNASNEIIEAPGADFSALLFDLMLRAIVLEEEKCILQGVLADGYPHEGLFVDVAVTDLPDVALTDGAALAAFVDAAILNQPSLASPLTSVLVAPPNVIPLIGGGGYPMAGCTPSGFNFLCYPLIPHTEAVVGAVRWLGMFTAQHIVYATDGQITMDINPNSGFVNGCSQIKIGQHFDHSLMLPADMARAVVTSV